jgi:hypothetical protein
MAAPKNTYPSGKASLTPPVRGVLQAVLFFNRKRRRARQEA